MLEIMPEFPNYALDFRNYAHKMTWVLYIEARKCKCNLQWYDTIHLLEIRKKCHVDYLQFCAIHSWNKRIINYTSSQ